MLPPLERRGLEPIHELLEQGKYFVLHAPRQTGKTTALRALAKELCAKGYRVVYANIEPAQTARNDVRSGIETVLGCIAREGAIVSGELFLEKHYQDLKKSINHNELLAVALSQWSQADPERPAILFLDEIDSLVGDTLVSVLRQLRSGYPNRPAAFPQAVILCGVRDVKDYRIQTKEGEVITGGSCFNIKARSLRIGDFTRENMETLYAQHTAATGQMFTDTALDLAWGYTQGQPWLINALGQECCFEDAGVLDRSRPIDRVAMQLAKERLVLSRATHLDQLADKLQEPRVYRVIEPIIEGRFGDLAIDDLEYCKDLGLVRRDAEGLSIANAIYREVIPRELTQNVQINFSAYFRPDWILADGRLDVPHLFRLFTEFWHENGEIWSEGLRVYKEAAPHLILQAFLQRVINGKGQLLREYALGRRRTDLLIKWPLPDQGEQKIVIELKVVHRTLEKTIADGLKQTAEYAKRCNPDESHLLVFRSFRDALISSEENERVELTESEGIQIWILS